MFWFQVGQLCCPLLLIVGEDDQNWPAEESARDVSHSGQIQLSIKNPHGVLPPEEWFWDPTLMAAANTYLFLVFRGSLLLCCNVTLAQEGCTANRKIPRLERGFYTECPVKQLHTVR